MNYYGSYTGNKRKKTVRRIIIVILCVAIIFGGTVVFGNYLKKKSAMSGVNHFGGVGKDDSNVAIDTPVIIPPSEGGSGSSVSVQGYCVPLRVTEDEKENGFGDRLTTAAKNNTGVLIPLTGEDGCLLYNSDRAAAASRLPANPTIPDMAALSDAVAKAKAAGLRTTAMISSGVDLSASEDIYNEAIAADARIAADVAEAGFDELVICSVVSSPEDITGDSATVMLRYLNQMTAASGNVKVGLSLPAGVYETATLSPQIELFLSRPIFLAMELSTEKSTVDHLTYICENLAGTLSLYNMRMLMSPKDSAVAEAVEEKLDSVEHRNYLFTNVPVTVEDRPADDKGQTNAAVTE